MKKKRNFRGWIQAAATLGTNAHLSGFITGRIYTGAGKNVCVPGLNCYSCPGAVGSCPIGATQAVIGGRKHNFAFYTLGLLLMFGMLLGRVICGFLCPFGWFQELIHKIPLPKKKPRIPQRIDRPMRYAKYVILLVFVILLPALWVNEYGQASPYFCKLICPAGTLEGGIPLLIHTESLRASLGWLFNWKAFLLIVTIVSSLLICRPFCKYICPLGAFYALLNKISLLRMQLDQSKCISCGACVRACPMQVDVIKDINSAECIRCGKCKDSCAVGAIKYSFGKVSVMPNAIPENPAE